MSFGFRHDGPSSGPGPAPNQPPPMQNMPPMQTMQSNPSYYGMNARTYEEYLYYQQYYYSQYYANSTYNPAAAAAATATGQVNVSLDCINEPRHEKTNVLVSDQV